MVEIVTFKLKLGSAEFLNMLDEKGHTAPKEHYKECTNKKVSIRQPSWE